MSVQHPIILPNETTLHGPQGHIYLLQHANKFQLVAWLVSGKHCRVKDYQDSLQHLSQTPKGWT